MKNEQLCYLCGKTANTFDHVPPKAFFPINYTRKGYKIPACASCNNQYSKDEEYIRDCFSIAGNSEFARKVFLEGTRKSYLRPYSRLTPITKHQRILNSLSEIDIKTKAGIVLGKATGIKIDIHRIERVHVKIVKGLFYWNLNKSMPVDSKISFFMNPENFLPELLSRKSPILDRFDEVFAYKAIIAKDGISSVWWLSFYKTLGSIVTVEQQ